MAHLPRVIGSLDDLPEATRDVLKTFYVPGDGDLAGKLVLDGPNEDVTALQGVLINERTQRAQAVADAAAAKIEADRLKVELAKKPPATADAKEWERKLQNLEDAYKADKKVLQEQIETERNARVSSEKASRASELRASLRKAAIDAGASEKGAEDAVDRMLKVVNEKDGVYVPIDDKGNVILGKKTAPSQPMSWKELAGVVLEDATHLRKPSAGGNAQGGEGLPNGGSAPFTLTRSEAKNPQVYRAKREEAAKVGQEVTIVPDPV